MLHSMHLEPTSFNQVKNGTKTIEIRLNDEKRRLLTVGDTIEFALTTNPEEKIQTQIVDLIRVPTFSELFGMYPHQDFGAENREDLMKVYDLYTKEDEVKYGVVGIQLK